MVRFKQPAGVAGILVAGLVLAILLPIAATPYQGDDIFNSYIDGAIRSAHMSFWQFIFDLNANWMRNGRFFPGALIESYGLFHIMPSLGLYKAFQIAITLLNVGTFYVLLRQIGIARALSLLGVIILICTFQLRLYHDGLLGFSGNIEFIMEIALLSTLGLLLYARNGNRWLLFGSLAAYAIGLVTYEVTYLFWLFFLAILLVDCPWRKALLLTLPYFALSAGVIVIQLLTKAGSHAPAGSDYSVSLHLRPLIRAFFEQTIAAIPLTYVAIDPGRIIPHRLGVFAAVPQAVLAGIFALAALGTWVTSGQVDKTTGDRAAIRKLALLGFLLWTTPALLVAASARYQRELMPGLGHVPVYIEYFGVALLLVAICAGAVAEWGVPGIPARLALALVVGCSAVTLYATNAVVIGASMPDKEGLMNMQAALGSGIARAIPAGSDLYVDSSISAHRYLDGSAADASYYYFDETGLSLHVHSIGSIAMQCTTECRVGPNAYELLNVPAGEYAGVAALGHVVAVANTKGDVTSYASDVTLFARGIPPGTRLVVQFAEHGCNLPNRTGTRFLPRAARGVQTVHLKLTCGTIALNTLAIAAVSVAAR